MKKMIEIDPVDTEMEIFANAVRILNAYKRAGFVKRESFVECVMGEDSSYHTFQGFQKLNNFWAGRVKDVYLNADLEAILDNLKQG